MEDGDYFTEEAAQEILLALRDQYRWTGLPPKGYVQCCGKVEIPTKGRIYESFICVNISIEDFAKGNVRVPTLRDILAVSRSERLRRASASHSEMDSGSPCATDESIL